MKPELWLEILYQLHLIEKLLEKEQSPIKRVRYEGMKEALLYILDYQHKILEGIPSNVTDEDMSYEILTDPSELEERLKNV